MKKFTVTIDITLSGDIEIEAKTKKEAKEKALSKYYCLQDLSDFHEISKKVYEVQ